LETSRQWERKFENWLHKGKKAEDLFLSLPELKEALQELKEFEPSQIHNLKAVFFHHLPFLNHIPCYPSAAGYEIFFNATCVNIEEPVVYVGPNRFVNNPKYAIQEVEQFVGVEIAYVLRKAA